MGPRKSSSTAEYILLLICVILTCKVLILVASAGAIFRLPKTSITMCHKRLIWEMYYILQPLEHGSQTTQLHRFNRTTKSTKRKLHICYDISMLIKYGLVFTHFVWS